MKECIIVAVVIIVGLAVAYIEMRSNARKQEDKYKKWIEISNNAREQRMKYYEQDLKRHYKNLLTERRTQMSKDCDSGYAVYRVEELVDDGRNWHEECKIMATRYNELMESRNKALKENRELKETIVKMCKNL